MRGAAVLRDMTDLQKLRAKLCRELAQSEHSAEVHPRREARRLGSSPPAVALRAISDHAATMKPRFAAVIGGQHAGLAIGRAFGEAFSGLRQAVFDRVIDVERSYRGTLLGVTHGLDVVRMLRAIAVRSGDVPLAALCDEWLVTRIRLSAAAEAALTWFAARPEVALQSGLRIALS